jgi:hypothetical protein
MFFKLPPKKWTEGRAALRLMRKLLKEPKVRGLSAGGSRIRTPGPTSEPHLRRTVQAGVNA